MEFHTAAWRIARGLGLALVGSALVHAAAPPGQAGRDGDVVVLPSAGYEEYRSPSGTHVLGLRVGDHVNAHSARSAITLYRVTASQRMTLWTRELPHRPRPRFLLVADGGHVVLLDEWLNVRSNYAAMVIGPDNRVLGQYDLESIRAALGVPIGTVTSFARHGPWIQALPTLTPEGEAVEIASANRVLAIRLRDARLSAR